jgi:hypothetical protein
VSSSSSKPDTAAAAAGVKIAAAGRVLAVCRCKRAAAFVTVAAAALVEPVAEG